MAKVLPGSSVPPLSAPHSSRPSLSSKRALDGAGFAHGSKKLRAVPPFQKEPDSKEGGAQATGAGVAVSCLLGPAPPEAYSAATALCCLLNLACAPDRLKDQVAFPFSPLVIPAFPAHFLTRTGPAPLATGLMHLPPASFNHRLNPASAAWSVPLGPTYVAPHFFHLNTKL